MAFIAIGKKASICRKCYGESHYVNKLGGICCSNCSPPTDKNPATMFLRIDAGFWQDINADRSVSPVSPKLEENRPVSSLQRQPLPSAVPGQLSEFEADVYLSDEVWGTPESPKIDQWIVFKKRNPRARVAAKEEQVSDPNYRRPVIPPNMRRKLIPPGTEIRLTKSIATFNGPFRSGPAIVQSSFYDAFGCPLVNLEREGRIIATGVELCLE